MLAANPLVPELHGTVGRGRFMPVLKGMSSGRGDERAAGAVKVSNSARTATVLSGPMHAEATARTPVSRYSGAISACPPASAARLGCPSSELRVSRGGPSCQRRLGDGPPPASRTC
jgi:hypothetical protein